MTVTLESLKAMERAALRLRESAPLRIVFTPMALETTEERLFPASKNRSRRIRKKLIKRFGSEFRMKPTMWQIGATIYAHPALRASIEAAIPAQQPPRAELRSETMFYPPQPSPFPGS